MKTTQEYLAFINQIEEASFQRGYQAAVQKMLQAVGQNVTVTPGAGCPAPANGKNPFKEGSDSAAVFAFVRANSGLRGAEIIKKSGIAPKTVRTALHRLKVKGHVANDDGRWFVR